jgi:hypothetical protein
MWSYHDSNWDNMSAFQNAPYIVMKIYECMLHFKEK